MLIVRITLVILIVSNFLLSAGLQYLTKSITAQTAFETVSTDWVEDVHSSGVAKDDGIDQDVPLGFSFPFNGTTYTEVDIDANGYLVFGNDPKSVYTNGRIPQSDKAQSIYPYWDDLNVANGGTIRYDTIGSGEDIHFVVSWENVPQYPSNGAYSLQVILYKDGSIRFRYDDETSINGASGTVGVQENTDNYDEHSYNNTDTFDASKDILYSHPNAKMSLEKLSCVIRDPLNGTSNPKRVPTATIRYAIEVQNRGNLAANNVKVDDQVSNQFDTTTIENIQIQLGECDCLGVTSASNNGVNGTGDGENPVTLDFGTVLSGTESNPTSKCGYFEVEIK